MDRVLHGRGVGWRRRGPWLVAVLAGCGLIELAVRTHPHPGQLPAVAVAKPLVASAAAGGLTALAWVAINVGALSYGGGFVIVPLMQTTPSAATTG